MTATVDYGNGVGPQPLELDGRRLNPGSVHSSTMPLTGSHT